MSRKSVGREGKVKREKVVGGEWGTSGEYVVALERRNELGGGNGNRIVVRGNVLLRNSALVYVLRKI